MKRKHSTSYSYHTVFVDTNVFYNVLFETEYADVSQQLLETIPNPATSHTVVNELVFIVVRKAVERRYGVRSYYEFRRVIGEKGYTIVEDYIDKTLGLLEDSEVKIVDDYYDLDEWLKIMKNYRLLPNDAQTTLTCKHYGINTIATFDKDSKRVPWLKVIP